MIEPNSEASAHEQKWAVHRIDDNGNQFVVKGRLTRQEAEQHLVEYEARGHKQTYWIEPDPE